MDIKTFAIRRFDLEFVLCWRPHTKEYYIQALERGEWVEDFSDLLGEKLPDTRDDVAAIRVTEAYVDSVREELMQEVGAKEPDPDWEAQARYDEMHGTVNGEDPNIAAWKEAFPYGG